MKSFCVLDVGDRRVGLPMSEVREIIELSMATPVPVPLAPGFVRGLFNLRGQVIPLLDLAPFVGASRSEAADDRAVVVEKGEFRFAAQGSRIDAIEVDPAGFKPLEDAALFPALEAEATSERGAFLVLHVDRLEACLARAMNLTELAA